MSTPSDDRPTVVQPAVEQPTVTTAPPTRRTAFWQGRIPARLGRARTSTVVIGCLFVLLFALHTMVAPDPVEYTSIVDANTGATIQVPASLVPSAPPTTVPATTTAPSSTDDSTPQSTSAPATTSGGSRTTTSGAPTTTAGSGTTAPRSTSAPGTVDPTEAAPAESDEPTSEAPAPSDPETSAEPTS